MTPSTEFADLLDHAERLWNASLLLAITFALLVVSGVTLLFTVFITFFSMSRNWINKWTVNVTAEKGATFDALKP
jgi:hypothetical protein